MRSPDRSRLSSTCIAARWQKRSFYRAPRDRWRGLIDTIALYSGGRRNNVYTNPRQDIMSIAYSPSGHILFEVQGRNKLWALPFSASKLEATGEPVLIYSDAAQPGVANDGTLIFRSQGGRSPYRFARVDRAGRVLSTIGTPRFHTTYPPRWSSDGKQILASTRPDGNATSDLWIYEQTNQYQLTFLKEQHALYPARSPDGSSVAFARSDPNVGRSEVALLTLNGGEARDLARVLGRYSPQRGTL